MAPQPFGPQTMIDYREVIETELEKFKLGTKPYLLY